MRKGGDIKHNSTSCIHHGQHPIPCGGLGAASPGLVAHRTISPGRTRDGGGGGRVHQDAGGGALASQFSTRPLGTDGGGVRRIGVAGGGRRTGERQRGSGMGLAFAIRRGRSSRLRGRKTRRVASATAFSSTPSVLHHEPGCARVPVICFLLLAPAASRGARSRLTRGFLLFIFEQQFSTTQTSTRVPPMGLGSRFFRRARHPAHLTVKRKGTTTIPMGARPHPTTVRGGLSVALVHRFTL